MVGEAKDSGGKWIYRYACLVLSDRDGSNENATEVITTDGFSHRVLQSDPVGLDDDIRSRRPEERDFTKQEIITNLTKISSYELRCY